MQKEQRQILQLIEGKIGDKNNLHMNVVLKK